MHAMRIVRAAALITAAILVGAATSPAEAPGRGAAAPEQPPRGHQAAAHNPIPDTFTNLQVLPKTIDKADLVQIMKSFCQTFEKRCSYCHVATDDLSQADFASDEKEPKKKARLLLRYVHEVYGSD